MSYATDAWTSPNHKAYVAVTVHFEKDGVPISMLLNIVEVARSHSGLNLATAFAKILDDFGISDKVSHYFEKKSRPLTVDAQILSITCDNALNNDTMITELTNLLDEFPGPVNQTRCFMHVLNLVVKSIIQQFDLLKSKGDVVSDEAMKELLTLAGNIEFEEEELARSEGEEVEDDNVEGWIDECMLMTEDKLEELEESVEPLQLLLTKAS